MLYLTATHYSFFLTVHIEAVYFVWVVSLWWLFSPYWTSTFTSQMACADWTILHLKHNFVFMDLSKYQAWAILSYLWNVNDRDIFLVHNSTSHLPKMMTWFTFATAASAIWLCWSSSTAWTKTSARCNSRDWHRTHAACSKRNSPHTSQIQVMKKSAVWCSGICVVWLVKKNISVYCVHMYVLDLCMLTCVRVNGWVALPSFLLVYYSKIKAWNN